MIALSKLKELQTKLNEECVELATSASVAVHAFTKEQFDNTVNLLNSIAEAMQDSMDNIVYIFSVRETIEDLNRQLSSIREDIKELLEKQEELELQLDESETLLRRRLDGLEEDEEYEG